MNEKDLSRKEMDGYCRYLLGKEADEQSLNLFTRAIQHEETTPNPDEIKLIEFILKNHWSISLIDAALGVFYPLHRMRKRMIIAFAILETNPMYYDFFRPKQYGRQFLGILIFKATKESIKAVIGRIILLFI